MWFTALLSLALVLLLSGTHGQQISNTYLEFGQVETINDYSLEHLSIVDYDPVNATLVVYNPTISCPLCLDACVPYDLPDFIPAPWLTAPNGKLAIVISASYCEVTNGVANVVQLKKQLEVLAKRDNTNVEIVAVMQLFEPLSVAATNDEAPRYTRNPYPIREEGNLIVNRAHGRDAGFVFRELMGCQFEGLTLDDPADDTLVCEFPNKDRIAKLVQVTFEFTLSPWRETLSAWPWATYAVIGWLTYFYMSVYCIRSLIFLSRKEHGTFGSSMNLQNSTLIVMLVLVLDRTVDFSITFTRDVLGLFVPELFGQLIWIWGYVLACIAFMMLVLYWAELVRETSRKLTTLSAPSQRVVITFSISFFTMTTIFMLLFSLRVTSFSILFLFASTGMLAIVAFTLAIGLIYYARKIIKRLNTHNLNELESTQDKLGESNTSRSAFKTKQKKLMKSVKKIRPLTRLTMTSASMIMVIVCLVGVTFLSPILEKPDAAYVVLFIIVGVAETVTYGLMIYTISPIKKKKQSTAGTTNAELSTSAGPRTLQHPGSNNTFGNTGDTGNNSYSGMDYYDNQTTSGQDDSEDDFTPMDDSSRNMNGSITDGSAATRVPPSQKPGFRFSKFITSWKGAAAPQVKFEDVDKLI